MGSKILEFLGLSGHSEDAADDYRRRNRRDDYMKKFHGLADPEDGEDIPADEDQPVSGYVAVKDDPLTEEISVPAEPAQTPPEEKAPEKDLSRSSSVEKPQKYDRREKHAAEKTFSGKFRIFGESLRRPKDGAQPLVLVKKGALEMIDDIEEALIDGQTVLLDFEREERSAVSEVVTHIVNFVRVHNGVYYTVTSTSLLLSLEKNSVIEWLPESDALEQ